MIITRIYYYRLSSLSRKVRINFPISYFKLWDSLFAINADFSFIWVTFERAVAASKVWKSYIYFILEHPHLSWEHEFCSLHEKVCIFLYVSFLSEIFKETMLWLTTTLHIKVRLLDVRTLYQLTYLHWHMVCCRLFSMDLVLDLCTHIFICGKTIFMMRCLVSNLNQYGTIPRSGDARFVLLSVHLS